MNRANRLRDIVRVSALVLWSIWIFGFMLPNLGPFPELQPTLAQARRAEVLRWIWMAGYSLGFLVAAGFIWASGRRNSRWELVGWLVLVGLSFPPVSKVFF